MNCKIIPMIAFHKVNILHIRVLYVASFWGAQYKEYVSTKVLYKESF